MAVQRVQGQSPAEIGERFNLNPTTVSKEILWARREKLLMEAQDMVIEQLLPKALQSIGKHIEEGNYEAAKDVAYGTGVLNKNRPPGNPFGAGDVTIDMVRARIRSSAPRISENLGDALLELQERDYATRRQKKASEANGETFEGEIVGEQS